MTPWSGFQNGNSVGITAEYRALDILYESVKFQCSYSKNVPKMTGSTKAANMSGDIERTRASKLSASIKRNNVINIK